MSAASSRHQTLPYPGLRPFEESDRELFFGRETQVLALIRQLRNQPFVAVVGSSGSGKSSLVRAGLLPAVRKGFLLGTTDWRIVVLKPGHQPYLRLLRAIETELNPQAQAKEPLSTVEHSLTNQASAANPSTGHHQDPDASITPEETPAYAKLLRSDRGLLQLLDEYDIGPDSRVLLVVDQFEEIFAFRRAAADRDKVASRDEAAAFVRMLLCSCSEPDSPARVVLTMRSDFIGDCEAFLGLPEAISRSQFLVPRLDRSQMADAIKRPATIKDAAFDPFEFQEGLVNRIINDAGDRPDQLPLMQHALMLTWKQDDKTRLTHRDYEDAGGIEKALSKHADAAWDEIKHDPRQALIAQRLFLSLCDISPDGQITRRRPKVHEVMDVTGAKLDEIESIVRVFQKDDRNFLLPPENQPLSPETMLDISHEALLRRWELFSNQWQEQERSDTAELRHLVEQASHKLKGEGGLIPAEDLPRISRWRERVSQAWSARYTSEQSWTQVLKFIKESEEEVERKRLAEEQAKLDEAKRLEEQAQVRTAFAVILVIASIICVSLIWQARSTRYQADVAVLDAKRATARMYGAEAGNYALKIGTSDYLQPAELDSLWQLAQLDSASKEIRKLLIERWFRSDADAAKPFENDGAGLRAAMGLNVTYRGLAIQKLTELANQSAAKLADTEERDSSRLSTISDTLNLAVPLIESKDAATIFESLTTALLKPAETDTNRLSVLSESIRTLSASVDAPTAARMSKRLVDALVASAVSERSSSLSNVILTLAIKLDAADATRLTETIVTALATTTEAERSWAVADVISEFATKLDSADAVRFTKELLTALQNVPISDAARRAEIIDATRILAHSLTPADARQLVEPLVGALQNREEVDASRLSLLGSAIVVLEAKLDPADATILAGSLVTALEQVPLSDIDRRAILAEAIEPIVDKLAPEDAIRAVESLVKSLENGEEIYSDNLSRLVSMISVLGAKIDQQLAMDLAVRLSTALASPQEMDGDRLESFSGTVLGLADNLEPSDAARLANILKSAFDATSKTDKNRAALLFRSFAALTGKLALGDVTQFAGSLVTALEQVPHSEVDRRATLAEAIEPILNKLAHEDAKRFAESLVKSLENREEIDPRNLSRLESAISVLGAKIDQQLAMDLAERLATALASPKETDSDRLKSLSGTVSALAAKVEPPDAARLAESLIAALNDPALQDYQHGLNLGNAISKIVTNVNSVDAARLAKSLMPALNEPALQLYYGKNRWNVISKVVTNVNSTDAADVFHSLVKVLERDQELASDVTDELLIAVTSLSDKLNSADTIRFSRMLVQTLSQVSEEHVFRLSVIEGAILELLSKVEETKAPTFVAEVLRVLETTPLANAGRRVALVAVVVKLLDKVDDADAPLAAQELVRSLGDRTETDRERLTRLASAISLLSGRIDNEDVVPLAERLIRALTNPIPDETDPDETDPDETDPDRQVSLSNAISALMLRVPQEEASPLIGLMITELESLSTKLTQDETATDERVNLSIALGDGIVASLNNLTASDATRTVDSLVRCLTVQVTVDVDQLSRLAAAISTLKEKVDGKDRLRMAKVLVGSLADAKETDLDRLSTLESTIRDLDPQFDRSEMALALVTSKNADPDPSAQQNRRTLLGRISLNLLTAHNTQLLSLENIFTNALVGNADLTKPPEGDEESTDRKLARALCHLLSTDELAAVAKWPVCVADAERLVVDELQQKTDLAFDGDVWKFVSQADKLGIDGIGLAAKRPRIEDAIRELESLKVRSEAN